MQPMIDQSNRAGKSDDFMNYVWIKMVDFSDSWL